MYISLVFFLPYCNAIFDPLAHDINYELNTTCNRLISQLVNTKSK